MSNNLGEVCLSEDGSSHSVLKITPTIRTHGINDFESKQQSVLTGGPLKVLKYSERETNSETEEDDRLVLTLHCQSILSEA